MAPRAKTTTSSKSAQRSETSRSSTILLVRHGQTPTTGKLLPGRAPGLHLAPTGKEQADKAAQRIGEITSVAALYTSPLERARETAAPIASALGLPAKVRRGLLECDFGDWTGKELKNLMKLPEWSTVQRAPSTFRFPGGESFTEMQTRIVGALEEIRDAHPGEVVVCVSHADPIKAAVAYAMGTHLDLFQRIVISTCSISAITWTPHGPAVLTVNSTGGPLSELALS
jgi:probable phosphomutase (TIGR03848 family)